MVVVPDRRGKDVGACDANARWGCARTRGAYLADKVTSPFWKKRKLHSCEYVNPIAFRTSQPRPNTKGGVVPPDDPRTHSPSRRMLARPYAECEPSREATHRDRHGVAWHRPHPLPGCRSGLWRAVSRLCTTVWYCCTDWDEYVDEPEAARALRSERLAASEEASDAALRRLRDRAAAREEVARRIAAMSSGDAQTWRQKNESRGERDESESAALVRR